MAEIGLATAAATANQIKSMLNLMPEEKGRPKFGSVVDREREGKCPYIEVFMACHGRFDKFNVVSDSMELRRERMLPSDTALYARDVFGKERGTKVGQEDIKDENGYTLSKELREAPLHTLSSGCRLNLNFVYRRNVISEGVVKARDEITSAGQTVVNAATNTPSWWESLKSPSSSAKTSPNDSE